MEPENENLIEELAEMLSDFDDQFIWQYRADWDKASFRSRAEMILATVRSYD